MADLRFHVDTIIEYSQELSHLSEEDLELDVVFWIDAGEFLVSFLLVFRTAVNSESFSRRR